MLYTLSIESLAMIVENLRGEGQAKMKNNSEVWCTYCNKSRHTREVLEVE